MWEWLYITQHRDWIRLQCVCVCVHACVHVCVCVCISLQSISSCHVTELFLTAVVHYASDNVCACVQCSLTSAFLPQIQSSQWVRKTSMTSSSRVSVLVAQASGVQTRHSVSYYLYTVLVCDRMQWYWNCSTRYWSGKFLDRIKQTVSLIGLACPCVSVCWVSWLLCAWCFRGTPTNCMQWRLWISSLVPRLTLSLVWWHAIASVNHYTLTHSTASYTRGNTGQLNWLVSSFFVASIMKLWSEDNE